MNAARFDALTRALPKASRLAPQALALGAEGKKKNIFKRCRAQVAPCGTFIRNSCGIEPFCDAAIACCDSLATCDVGTFLICLNTPQTG